MQLFCTLHAVMTFSFISQSQWSRCFTVRFCIIVVGWRVDDVINSPSLSTRSILGPVERGWTTVLYLVVVVQLVDNWYVSFRVITNATKINGRCEIFMTVMIGGYDSV
jgi:hypothetical protein